MTRSLRGAFLALFALLVVAAPASAEIPANANWSEAYISDSLPYPAGQPTLHADIMTPKGYPAGTKFPVILSIGPYFNHSGQTMGETPDGEGPQLRWNDLIKDGKVFEHGYALVQVDLRGFGGSQGCNDFGGPGEQNDVARAIAWAKTAGFSDGHVAIFGKSYDGWTGVMGLNSSSDKLTAAIIQSPIIDGYRTLYQDGVHYGSTWYATPGIYQVDDAMPPALGDFTDGHTDYIAGWATGENPACYATNILMQDGLQTHDDAAGFWKARDLPNARGSSVPTFWSHGFLDVNTKPDNFLPVWSTLKGPKHAWFGQYHHTRPNEDDSDGSTGRHQYFYGELFSFLDEYMKAAPHVALPPVEVEDSDGKWRSEDVFPPADGVNHAIALRAGSYTDSPTASDTIWSITPALTHDARISGVTRAAVKLTTTTPNAVVIVRYWDIDGTGAAAMISRGAGVYTGMGAGTKDIELYPADYIVHKDHRIGVEVTANDGLYTPTPSGQTVTVTGGTLTAPFLTWSRAKADGWPQLPGTKSKDQSGREKKTVTAATIAASQTTWDEPPAMVARP